MSIRSRIGIPGGTCEFDLPAYYAWQQHPPRSAAPTCCNGSDTLMPLAEALQVLLGLLRESGVPHKVVANGGQYSAEPAHRAHLPADAREAADWRPTWCPRSAATG